MQSGRTNCPTISIQTTVDSNRILAQQKQAQQLVGPYKQEQRYMQTWASD